MKITIDARNFNTIKELTDYLEDTYEKDKSVSSDVSLNLDELDVKNSLELIQFLLKPERPRAYKFNLSTKNPNAQQLAIKELLDNAYLTNKRQKFPHNFRDELAKFEEASNEAQPLINKVRKAKLNWVQGRQGATIGLQIQQQQQQQQQQQNQKPAGQRNRRKKDEFDLELVAASASVASDSLGDLIDRANIAESLQGFTNDQHLKVLPDLLVVWDRLVGKDSAKIKEIDRKITHVQTDAMKQIIRNYPECSYGLVFDNLPAGFYLQKTEDNKNVLCFDEALQLQHRARITPLTLVLGPTQHTEISGSHKQFILTMIQRLKPNESAEYLQQALDGKNKDFPNIKQYEAQFKYLTGDKVSFDKRKEAFDFFLTELTGKNSAKLDTVNDLLKSLPLNDTHYQGLAHVLTHAGEDGVLLVLQRFKELNDKELFKDFSTLFLDNIQGYSQLVTPEGLAHLKKLASFDSVKHTWWNSLVEQHKAAGGRTDFNELFTAYEHFLTQLDKMTLTLPLSCSLQNIRHMKPALERVLFILQNAIDREEQLDCLNGLDYDVNGAYFASRYNGYKLVSRQMDLTTKIDSRVVDYTLPVTPRGFFDEMSDVDFTKYDTAKSLFYRFIGEQEWAFSLDVYQRIEEEITGNDDYYKDNKLQLFTLAALTTTGERAYKNTDPDKEFSNFSKKIIDCSKIYQAAKAQSFNTSVTYILGAFNLVKHCTPNSMPTINEMNQIMDVLLLTQQKEPSEQSKDEDIQLVVLLAFNLIIDYPNAISAFIANYKSRFVAEQSKTQQIKTFSFAKLISLLSHNVDLKETLISLFKDAPESLTQFIILLTLVNDPVDEANMRILAAGIMSLEKKDREALLSVLTDINIEASYSLPSFNGLQQIIADLRSDPGLTEAERKSYMLQLVEKQLPDTRIGNKPVKESSSSIFDVLKTILDELDLETNLKNFPENLKGYLSDWEAAHKELNNKLRKDPLNQHELFEALVNEDRVLGLLLNKTVFKLGVSVAFAAKPELKKEIAEFLGINETTLDEFFEKKSLLILIKDRIKEAYTSNLSRSIKSLQSANSELDQFLLTQIPDLNINVPIDKALKDFDINYNSVDGFVNALIRVKNQNNTQFRRCIDLLVKEVEAANKREDKKTVLTFSQMTSLLDALRESNPNSISGSLDIIFKVLQRNPNRSADEIDRAVKQITYLTDSRNILAPEAYDTLLRLSFTHNLTNESLFPLQQMIGFKKLVGVNEEQSEDLFDAFVEVVKKVGPDVDDVLLKNVIDKTTAIIQAQVKVNPNIVPLITLLIKTCPKSTKSELVRYYTLINKLGTTDDVTLKKWIKILTALGENISPEHIEKLLRVQAGLVAQESQLNNIASLFDYPPYPELDKFSDQLEQATESLKQYISSFDTDPRAARTPKYNAKGELVKSTEQILNEQFDTSQVARIVKETLSIVNEEHLSSEQQYNLAQQMTYITAIGKDYPITVGGKTCPNLTQATRAQLREFSDLLKDRIRTPGLSNEDKLKDQLKLLAVMREQYFRATGKFVYTTQILSVLMSLANQNHNMLMEINTGEGKSITTALLAAMQWVNADGGTVDVCTANQGLVDQDYKDPNQGAKNFFTSLGIPSAAVKATSEKGTYQVGGINYSTIGDLALYRSRAKVEHEDLIVKKMGVPLSSNLILDESDFSTLDDRTLFNFSTSAEGGGDTGVNPYAWIYPLVNEFINGDDFKNIKPPKDIWSEEQDITKLKIFLDSSAPTSVHKIQLKGLTDKKFSLWINSACVAQQLKKGEDFTILPSKTSKSIAVPYNQKVPQVGSTFSKGVQQFLHARLQKEIPGSEFDIEPEMMFVDSVSAKDLIDHYKKHGRIVGISGTLGTKNELVEQRGKFAMDVALRVPPHKMSQREELGVHVVKDNEKLVKKIADIINNVQKGQPIILIGKDANHVKELEAELAKQLKGSPWQIGSFTGEELDKTREDWVKHNAGQSHTITIATSLLGRGTDFKTDHPKGFLAIQTYLDTPRVTKQIIGRVGRNGQPGQYIAIYEENGSIASRSWFFETKQDKKIIKAAIRAIQSKKNEEAAVERYYIQSVSTMKQVVLQEFDEWQAFLHLITPKAQWSKLDSDLLKQRESLIEALGDEWNTILDKTDPKKDYPNPYIRRVNGKLHTVDLNDALKKYEQALDAIWKDQRAALKTKTVDKIQPGSVDAMRCSYLEGVELKEQLQLNKLSLRQTKKEVVKEQKNAQRRVEFGLNVNGAMSKFSDSGDPNLKNYTEAFVEQQLGLLRQEIIKEIKRSSLSADAKNILIDHANQPKQFSIEGVLIDFHTNLLAANKVAEKYRMQPIIADLFEVYQLLQIQETQDLKQLKQIYFDNVTTELVEHLESSLAWAKAENRGVGYFIERTAVKEGANEILDAIEDLKNTDIDSRPEAIKNLYKILVKHQAKLEGLWIFSFGHKNTRSLINKTLKTLDGLTIIGSGEDQLDADFIGECKEEAFCDVMKGQLQSAVDGLEVSSEDEQWQAIKQELDAVQESNHSIYAIDEMYYLLSKKREDSKTNPALQEHIVHLRGTIRSIWNKFCEKHPDMLSASKYFGTKAEQLTNELQELDGFKVKSVTLQPGHTGFNDYYDLVIEGSGSHTLFKDFERYKSRIPEIKGEISRLESLLVTDKQHCSNWEKAQKEQLPLLRSRENKKVDVALFPESYRDKVNEILKLNDYCSGTVPDNLEAFSPKIKNHFKDIDTVKLFQYESLTKEQIDTIQDEVLKSEFTQLFNKIHQVKEEEPKVKEEKPKGFFSRLGGLPTGLITILGGLLVGAALPRESEEDWRQQFAGLKAMAEDLLQKGLSPIINEKINGLSSDLTEELRKKGSEVESHGQNIEFLNGKINEEEKKTGVFVKRFSSLTEVYDFEMDLRKSKEAQPPVEAEDEADVDKVTLLIPEKDKADIKLDDDSKGMAP